MRCQEPQKMYHMHVFHCNTIKFKFTEVSEQLPARNTSMSYKMLT
jgi:hypothetical protein